MISADRGKAVKCADLAYMDDPKDTLRRKGRHLLGTWEQQVSVRQRPYYYLSIYQLCIVSQNQVRTCTSSPQAATALGHADSGTVPDAVIAPRKQVSGRQRLKAIRFADLGYMDGRMGTIEAPVSAP